MKKSQLVIGAVAVAVLAASVLPAQIEPAPYITIHYDRIDPAQTEAYTQNAKDWVEAFQEANAGEEFYWRAYQSGFTYAWVSDMPNYAFLDAGEARQKALNEKLGKGKMDQLMAGASDPIVEHWTEIWKFEPGMSYWPADFNPAGMKAVSVSTDSLKPGNGKAFSDLIEEAVAAMKKIEADVNWFAYSIPFGKGSYGFVSWAEDRAALHGGPDMGELLAEAVGEEAAKAMYAKYMTTVTGTEDRDWKPRSDLSYVSAEPMGEGAMEEGSE